MASSLSELKRASSSTLSKLKEISAAAGNKSSSGKDERMWAPFFDKEKGRGSAIIRFLPAPAGEDVPWVKVYNHGFKGPTGKWYIENSLSTLGSYDDPVGNLNSRLWNSGISSDQDVARSQKRKTSYYANIMVVKDPSNPAAEGKVFLYRFGSKIYDMIQSAIFPEDDGLGDKTELNPFDPWKGANFVIKMSGTRLGKDLVPDYAQSYFDSPSPISKDDDKIDEIWAKCESLSAFVDPKNFKSVDELKRRLYEVLGPMVGSGIHTVEGWGDASPTQTTQPPKNESASPRHTEQTKSSSSYDEEAESSSSDDASEDALLARLKSLM